jgi:hypothetical protein
MRPLVLAAPLLALATACAEPCTAPVLTVSWRFTLPDGTGDARCPAAGVDTVDLWLDGAPLAAGMACDQGTASFTGVAAGAHAFTMRGNGADGAVRSQTWGDLAVAACGETRATMSPGAGTLRVAYPTSTGLCASAAAPATNGYVWYQLLDRTTGLTASAVNAATSPTQLPCALGDQAWFELPVAWGLYRLRWIQVVTSPLATNPTPIFQYCPALAPPPVPTIDVDVVASGRTTLTVPLAPPTGPCLP